MSGGGLKLHDVRKLADARASFDFDVPLRELSGVPPEVGGSGGRVRAQLRFGREQGFAIADVSLDAQLQLICQRCMAPMPLTLHARSPVLVVESEREDEDAPAGWETFLAPEGRLSLTGLVAEELLLALPIVPLHELGEACAAVESPAVDTRAPKAAEESGGTLRPFADLKALLEQGGRPPKR
jgi:uncharacterized protein